MEGQAHQEVEAKQDYLVHLDKVVLLVHLDQLVHVERLVQEDKLDLVVALGQEGKLDLRALVDLLEHVVNQVHQVAKEIQDPLDQLAHQDQEVQLVSKGHQVQEEKLVLQDHQVLQATVVRKDHVENLVQLELVDQLDALVLQDHQVHVEKQDLAVKQANLDQQVLQDHQVQHFQTILCIYAFLKCL